MLVSRRYQTAIMHTMHVCRSYIQVLCAFTGKPTGAKCSGFPCLLHRENSLEMLGAKKLLSLKAHRSRTIEADDQQALKHKLGCDFSSVTVSLYGAG